MDTVVRASFAGEKVHVLSCGDVHVLFRGFGLVGDGMHPGFDRKTISRIPNCAVPWEDARGVVHSCRIQSLHVAHTLLDRTSFVAILRRVCSSRFTRVRATGRARARVLKSGGSVVVWGWEGIAEGCLTVR